MAKTASSCGASGDRIKTDPAFERTRENMSALSRAGKAAKLLRTNFQDVTINAKDRVTQARLVKVTPRIITGYWITSLPNSRLISVWSKYPLLTLFDGSGDVIFICRIFA